MNITLQRLSMSDNGTFGVLVVDNRPLFTTLELPWKNNQRNISCIQAGIYKAIYLFSDHFQKYLFMLQNIPGRDSVEMHIGNTIADTHGCILLGMQYSLSEYAIVNSKYAFDSFMLITPKEGFTLTVKDINNETANIATVSKQV